jgi:hypothetical protein
MVSSPIGRQPSGVAHGACTNAEARRGALSDSVLAVMSTTACLTTAAIDGEARCKSVVTDARVLQRWPPAGATKQEGARLHALTLLPARLELWSYVISILLHPRFCFPTTSLTNPAASVGPLRFGDWPDACVMQRGPPGPDEMATIGPLTSAAAAPPLPPQVSFWEDDLQVLSANVVLLSLP